MAFIGFRGSVIPQAETSTVDTEKDEVQQKWILALTHDNDAVARQILDEVPVEMRSNKLLDTHLVLPRPSGALKEPIKQLSVTDYTPDRPWCLVAMHDSHSVMQVLLEYGADVLQVNRNGNNMLHVLAALASTRTEDGEKEIVATARYIRDILEPSTYKKLLLTENADGLRPLELASHLGSFSLFMFYFDTPDVYVTREDDHILYKIQYFDITEYVTGVRFYQSPLKGMMNVEEDRITSKQVEEMYLGGPMRSWLEAIYSVNIPLITIWAIFTAAYICLVLSCDMTIDNVCGHNTTYQNTHSISVTTKRDIFWSMNIISIIIIVIDIIELVQYIVFRPRWLNRVVYGKKKPGMSQAFYRITHFLAVLVVAVVTTVSLNDHYKNRISYNIGGYGVVAAIYGFVWSVVYFLQILPVIGHYAMAVQRMLMDFVNFSILFLLFFVSYSVGFFHLLNKTRDLPEFATFPSSLYGTFRVMLNMVDFRTVSEDISSDAYLLHISYVFMIAILLLNFLIAIFSSSYEQVNNHKETFIQMQVLSVAMTADQRFQTIFPKMRTYLLRRYFIHDNGRYFVPRVVDLPRCFDQNIRPMHQLWCIDI